MLVWQQNDSCLGTDGAQTLVSKSIMSLIDKICQGKLLLLLFFEEKKKVLKTTVLGLLHKILVAGALQQWPL